MFRNISVRTIAQSEHFTVRGYLTEAYAISAVQTVFQSSC